VESRLTRGNPPPPGSDDRLRLVIAARCIAAAVFGAMETWMSVPEPSLDDLARLTTTALKSLESGILAV